MIQEFWVAEATRHRGVGTLLLAALEEAVADRCTILEVGLPGAGYPGVASTSAFYESQGFTPIGVRAKKSL